MHPEISKSPDYIFLFMLQKHMGLDRACFKIQMHHRIGLTAFHVVLIKTRF